MDGEALLSVFFSRAGGRVATRIALAARWVTVDADPGSKTGSAGSGIFARAVCFGSAPVVRASFNDDNEEPVDAFNTSTCQSL